MQRSRHTTYTLRQRAACCYAIIVQITGGCYICGVEFHLAMLSICRRRFRYSVKYSSSSYIPHVMSYLSSLSFRYSLYMCGRIIFVLQTALFRRQDNPELTILSHLTVPNAVGATCDVQVFHLHHLVVSLISKSDFDLAHHALLHLPNTSHYCAFK